MPWDFEGFGFCTAEPLRSLRTSYEGNAFEQMFTGEEVFEDVKVYTDWRPDIMSMY